MLDQLGWTEERVDLLKKLWAEGRTCSAIAIILGGGATRNSVISKVHRLKITNRAKPALPGSPRHMAARRVTGKGRPGGLVKKRAPAKREALPPGMTVNAAAMRAPVWGLLPGAKGVRLVDHHEGQCRWGAGDPLSPDFLYCGEPVERPGGSWCAVHQRRATKTVEQSRAEAEEYKAAQRALV